MYPPVLPATPGGGVGFTLQALSEVSNLWCRVLWRKYQQYVHINIPYTRNEV